MIDALSHARQIARNNNSVAPPKHPGAVGEAANMAKVSLNKLAEALRETKPEDVFVIECVQQGIPQRVVTKDQLSEWLGKERAFWSSLVDNPDVARSSLVKRFRVVADMHIGLIDTIIVGDDVNKKQLEDYLQSARDFNLLIGQGRFGSGILALAKSSIDTALVVVEAFSNRVIGTNVAYIDKYHDRQILRAALIFSPAFRAETDLVESQARMIEARNTAHDVLGKLEEQRKRQEALDKWVEKAEGRINAFQDKTESRLRAFQDLYHKQMQTEAAAAYWQTKSQDSIKAARWWLAAFVILLFVPLVAAAINFQAIQTVLERLTAATADKFSLTPVVAISVPVLGYAWLLRHVSRLFIQNRTLGDDASYRRVMTMTYLGLSKDPTSGVTEAERAIILNALFRPAPPNTSEDGPPAGLLDLIKSPK